MSCHNWFGDGRTGLHEQWRVIYWSYLAPLSIRPQLLGTQQPELTLKTKDFLSSLPNSSAYQLVFRRESALYHRWVVRTRSQLSARGLYSTPLLPYGDWCGDPGQRVGRLLEVSGTSWLCPGSTLSECNTTGNTCRRQEARGIENIWLIPKKINKTGKQNGLFFSQGKRTR